MDPSTTLEQVSVDVGIDEGLCETYLVNNAKLFAGAIEVASADDNDTKVLCPALSQMVRVIVEWKEGGRDESLDAKGLLKDVR